MAQNLTFHKVKTLPSSGEGGGIYFVKDTGKVYIWNNQWEDYTTTAGKLSSSLIIGNKQYNGEKEVTITKSDIGLGNVDNTADKDKKVLQATNDGNGNNIDSTYYKLKYPIAWSNANFNNTKIPFISKLDNQFAALNAWAKVSMTCDGEYGGILEDLFKGRYEIGIYAKGTSTITININFSSLSAGKYPNYPYGDIVFFWYYKGLPSSFSVKIYNNYESQGIGWKELDVEKITESCWKVTNKFYGLTQIQITFTGNGKQTPAEYAACLSAIEFYGNRSTIQQPHPYVSKYLPETLYYALTAPNFIGNLNGTSKSSESLIWTEYK